MERSLFFPLFVLPFQIFLLFCTRFLSRSLTVFRKNFKSLSGRKIQMKDWFVLQMWPQYPWASFYDRLTILLKSNVSVCVRVCVCKYVSTASSPL